MAINTKTNGLYLPAENAAEVLSKVQENSFFQTVARRVPLTGSGASYTAITGDAKASIVGEAAEKPVTDPTFKQVPLTAYKFVAQIVVSDELVEDDAALYQELVSRLPNALAVEFDKRVIEGPTPGTGFNTLAGAAEVNIHDGEYAAIVAALRAAGDISHWGLNTGGEADFLGAVDGNGRPLFTLNPQTDGSVGSLIGRPVFRSKNLTGADVVGIAGDFAGSAIWGATSEVKLDISNQATVGGVSMWETNQSVVRAEVRQSFAVTDESKFVKLVNKSGE